MNGIQKTRYIAIGDSLTEGLGDESVKTHQSIGGWADRLAALIHVEHRGRDFSYANFALRGCNTAKILGQATRAAEQRPTLVTVMAGANDLMRLSSRLSRVEELMCESVEQLIESGAQVVMLNLIDPAHVWLAKSMRKPAKTLSQLVNRVAARYSLIVVDLNSRQEFSDLRMWSDDLAHFSETGHKLIANLVAEKLGFTHRWNLASLQELEVPLNSVRQKVKWFSNEALPFIARRLRGRTSGDSLEAKHSSLQQNLDFPIGWLADMQKVPLESFREELLVSEMGLEPTPAKAD